MINVIPPQLFTPMQRTSFSFARKRLWQTDEHFPEPAVLSAYKSAVVNVEQVKKEFTELMMRYWLQAQVYVESMLPDFQTQKQHIIDRYNTGSGNNKPDQPVIRFDNVTDMLDAKKAYPFIFSHFSTQIGTTSTLTETVVSWSTFRTNLDRLGVNVSNASNVSSNSTDRFHHLINSTVVETLHKQIGDIPPVNDPFLLFLNRILLPNSTTSATEMTSDNANHQFWKDDASTYQKIYDTVAKQATALFASVTSLVVQAAHKLIDGTIAVSVFLDNNKAAIIVVAATLGCHYVLYKYGSAIFVGELYQWSTAVVTTTGSAIGSALTTTGSAIGSALTTTGSAVATTGSAIVTVNKAVINAIMLSKIKFYSLIMIANQFKDKLGPFILKHKLLMIGGFASGLVTGFMAAYFGPVETAQMIARVVTNVAQGVKFAYNNLIAVGLTSAAAYAFLAFGPALLPFPRIINRKRKRQTTKKIKTQQ
jgi:hypothetical protein